MKTNCIFLFLLLCCLACKKPKDGDYGATFTDSNGNKTTYVFPFDRKGSTIKGYSSEGQIATPNGQTGTSVSIKLDKGKAEGDLVYGQNTVVANHGYKYTITGSYSRKKIWGTYVCRQTGFGVGGGFPTIITTGTFEIHLKE